MDEDGFVQLMINSAVANLTPREIEVLRLMDRGEELAQDGRCAYIGNERTSPHVVMDLLKHCAISQDSMSETYYHINETGRKIIAAVDAVRGGK
jgi:hypothetical protein